MREWMAKDRNQLIEKKATMRRIFKRNQDESIPFYLFILVIYFAVKEVTNLRGVGVKRHFESSSQI
jgi:hypothetical protein